MLDIQVAECDLIPAEAAGCEAAANGEGRKEERAARGMDEEARAKERKARGALFIVIEFEG